MRVKPLPPVEMLRKLLRYEPETGKLYWLPRTPDMFVDNNRSKEWNCNAWNARNADKEAFTADDGSGYKQGSLFHSVTKAHRIAYSIYYGEILKNGIDHINGIKSDNRIINLREANDSQQQMNTGIKKNNTTGVKGICWDKRRNSWTARITANKKNMFFGSFDTLDEAVDARHEAEIKYFGKFRRVDNAA